MANYQLANDGVDTIPIMTADANGDFVPAPAGDVFSAVSSNPASLGVAVVANAGLQLTPLVQVSPGLTVTLSDSAGLAVDVLTVDIVADVKPKSIALDVAHATTVSQPVPAAPGP